MHGESSSRREPGDGEGADQVESAGDEAIFAALVAGVKDYAIFMLDPGGHIMTWNEGARRIKGYSAHEIIGKHFSIFYTEEAKSIGHPDAELKIARQEGRYEEEGWRVRKDGSQFWANVLITAIYRGGQLLGFAKVTRDLTERRLAEQRLQASNLELRHALETKSRFLSTLSHEVRTPMSGILGMAELLSLQDLGEDNNHLVSNIFQTSHRLLGLLNNMLDSARIESGKFSLEYRRFPIGAALGDVRQLIWPEASKKSLTVTGRCDQGVPEFVCGDEIRLRQVLLNLAFNAVKFTNSGEIQINCSIVETKPESITLRFEVKDTGIGIAPEDQSRLFEPFEQLGGASAGPYAGSGLGLNISRSLVELMQGKIGLDSKPGAGSTFWFEVPFDERNCLS